MPKRPAPTLISFPESDDDTDPNLAGPVRVSIDYHIPEENYAEFTRAIHELRGVRLRDGAMRWGIYRDANNPEHLNETFIMESWLDYLRSRERAHRRRSKDPRQSLGSPPSRRPTQSNPPALRQRDHEIATPASDPRKLP